MSHPDHRQDDLASLSEEAALQLLTRADLPAATLAGLARQEHLVRDRRVKMALVRHARTPRTTSLPLIRQLYMDELVVVTQTPSIAGDVRRIAEDQVIIKLAGLSLGERVSLARRATGRVGGALLLDRETRVVDAALCNPQLTEELVVKALSMEMISVAAVEMIADHERWSLVYGVKLALLRNPQTSLGRVLAMAPSVKRRDLLEIVGDPRMPADRKRYLSRLAQPSKS